MTISSNSYTSSLLSTQTTTSTEQTKHKQPPSASDLVSKVMEKNDVNGDGILTADELSGMSSENFSAMDANGDGSLSSDELTTSFSSLMESMKNKEMSPEEFGSFLSSMGLEVPPPPHQGGGKGGPDVGAMATKIFDAKDTNQDGYLSADELELDSELFSSLDSDGNGNISKSEMEKGLKSLFESAKNGEIDQETFGSIMDKLGVEAPPPPPNKDATQNDNSSTSSTTSMEDYTLKLISTLIDALEAEQSNSSDNSTLDLKKFKEVMNMVNTQTQNSQTASELSEFLKNLTSNLGTSSSSYA